MKNVHVLPTDKTSRLVLDVNNNLALAFNKSIEENALYKRTIYITNDEEIKENTNVKDKWVISEYGFVVKADRIENNYLIHSTGGSNFLHHYKFIIMTTDPQLIQDGVQPIDDEFLEFIVKNPSCEWVEVDKNWNYPLDKSWEYKLRIIPKEEPKQLFTKGDKVLFTGKMLDENVVDKVVTVFYTLGRGEIDDMSDIMDEYTHVYRVWNKDLKHTSKEEPLSFEEFRKIASKELLEKFDTDCLEYSEDGDFDNYFYANCKYWESKLKEEPKQEFGYTTKMGVEVKDEMVRPLMVPKKYFGEVEHPDYSSVFDFLSDKDYLTDKREVIEKEFKEYLKK